MDKFEIRVKPADTITDVSFNGSVIVSSWDGVLYVYDIESRDLKSKYSHGIPITKILVCTNNILFSDIVGNVKILSNDFKDVASYETNLKGIHTLKEYNGSYLICGWDSQICYIQNNNLEYKEIKIRSQSTSLNGTNLALIEGDLVHILDLKTNSIIYTRKMNEQLRSIMIEDNKVYLGTYGGKLRVIDIISGSENVINAHQRVLDDKKILYPINQIEQYGRIYTCGSDGTLNRFSIGDKITQKVIHDFDCGILKFKKIGSKFVVCCGYNYEQGVGDTSNNPIYIFDAKKFT